MIALASLCLLGLAAGFVLLVRVPLCDGLYEDFARTCSVIIPARNEAQMLPRLLASIPRDLSGPLDLIVVDDHSTDGSACIAEQHGARVLTAPPLRQGWTGKTSACLAGAIKAEGELLLFLDADTWFEPEGFHRLLGTFAAVGQDATALSVLPFHVTRAPYEELSLFFNLMMVFGAGGFGVLGRGRLFGQSMLLSRALYVRSGTHEAVRGEILENVALAPRVGVAGGECVCRGGCGVLNMRMFPGGLRQLCEGWTKAFAAGASASDSVTLGLAVFWLSTLCSAFFWVLFSAGLEREVAAGFYLSFVVQTAYFARQVGSFRWYTFALYPVPLFFFFVIFGRSMKRRLLKQQVTWRGRQL